MRGWLQLRASETAESRNERSELQARGLRAGWWLLQIGTAILPHRCGQVTGRRRESMQFEPQLAHTLHSHLCTYSAVVLDFTISDGDDASVSIPL